MDRNHKQAISKALKGHKVSKETRQKIGIANRGKWHFVKCDACKKELEIPDDIFKRYKRRFCNKKCYSIFRRDLQPIEEHPRWQGGVSQTESHRRWKKKNPDRMAFLKARRYAREQGAKGSHTFDEWILLKIKFRHKCAICFESKPLTKDHIIPLSKGGSDFIENIQPLCRNCNSKKWSKLNIYENPELLKEREK